MANKNLGRVCENSDTALHEMKFKVAKALELVRKYAKICFLALLVSNGAAFAESVSTKDPVLLVSTSDAAPSGAVGGGIDYSSLSVDEIEEHIVALQAKIDLLKNGSGHLSRQEKMEIIGYYKELLKLEDLQQEALQEIIEQLNEDNNQKAEIIDNYDAALRNFENIKDMIQTNN